MSVQTRLHISRDAHVFLLKGKRAKLNYSYQRAGVCGNDVYPSGQLIVIIGGGFRGKLFIVTLSRTARIVVAESPNYAQRIANSSLVKPNRRLSRRAVPRERVAEFDKIQSVYPSLSKSVLYGK